MKNQLIKTLAVLGLFAVASLQLACGGLVDPALAQDPSATVVPFGAGDVVLEFVGAVINPSPTTSNQYGYFTKIGSIDPLFSSSTQDQTTALYTFFTQATTTQVITQGTLKIVSREGVTTVYTNNSSPLDFTNPASFQSGTPILVSSMKQQVILDLVDGHFSVVNVNTITSTSPFTVGGGQVVVGHAGDQFRTTIYGRTNATAPPGFFMAGYAVGIPPSK